MESLNKLKITLENESNEKNVLINSIDPKVLYRKSKRLTTISDMGIPIKYVSESDGVIDNSTYEPSISISSTVDMSIESKNTPITSTTDMSIAESDTHDIPDKEIEVSLIGNITSVNSQRNALSTRHFVTQVAIEKIKSFSVIPLQNVNHVHKVYDSLSDIIRELSVSNELLQNKIIDLQTELHIVKNRLSSVEAKLK